MDKSVQQRVLPGRGAAHLRQIVEALAQARAEPAKPITCARPPC